MSVYISADELPVVIRVSDLSVDEVEEIVRRWMRDSMVLTMSADFSAASSAEDVENGVALGQVLMNFGAIAVVWVRETAPSNGRTIEDIDGEVFREL